MNKSLDKTKNVASKISNVDLLIDWLNQHNVYIRIGHASHSYDVSQFVDATLSEVIKANLGINLNIHRSKLVAQLQAAALEV